VEGCKVQQDLLVSRHGCGAECGRLRQDFTNNRRLFYFQVVKEGLELRA